MVVKNFLVLKNEWLQRDVKFWANIVDNITLARFAREAIRLVTTPDISANEVSQ